MGAYLSEPITEKISSDDANDILTCGASSMQGWRVSQEDAHNCVLDFDINASLFAVYDGHGGSEVALYCAQQLPKFLRESDNYKKGEIEQALKDTFLGIDASVATRQVIEELKRLAGDKDNGVYEDESSEEDMDNLYQEASMPLEKLLAKYKSCPPLAKLKNEAASNPALDRLKVGEGSSKPVSPYLRGRRTHGVIQSDGASSSSAGCAPKVDLEDDSDDTAVSSSSTQDPQKLEQASSSENNEDVPASSTSNGDSEISVEVKPDMPDSSESVKDVEDKLENDVPESSTDTKLEPSTPVKEMNGEVSGSDNIGGEGDSTKNENVSSSSNLENGEVSESNLKGKGKGKAKVTQISSSADTSSIVKAIKNYAEKLLLATGEDDSDSEENDETFNAKEPANSSEDEELEIEGDDDEEAEDSSDAEEDDEDNVEDEEEELQAEDNEFMAQMTEEPGSDSGCTAVVALLHNKNLYVANAGDSRCVVCRAGKAVEMSFDHKPEDEPEMNRILKAGGRVTPDGRVNGGLNLSRAIGDHAYKQNKELGVDEQMISPLPDIKKLELNDEDEFIVLACDGIWNFMSSQDVVDFVRPRIQEGREKLSQICEEMFDHCLAPHTMGDGTGCDNMTAVIVLLKNSQKSKPISTTETETKKRAASQSPACEEQTKKPRTEESSSVDTSTQ